MPEQQKYPLTYLPVSRLKPVAWNANKMAQPDHDRLGQEMLQTDPIEVLQVIPDRSDGCYWILGGEHRWRAAQATGIEELPCIVLDTEKWTDEDTQQLVAWKINYLRGKPDPDKFLALQKRIAEKFGPERVQGLLAIRDTRLYKKLLEGVKKSVAKSLPPAMKDQASRLDAATSVQDIQRIVQDIFHKHGNTADKGYMVFTHAGQPHVYVPMSPELNTVVRKLVKQAKDSEENFGELLLRLLQPGVAPTAPRQKAPRKEKASEGEEPSGAEF